jgi:hypothetical protein
VVSRLLLAVLIAAALLLGLAVEMARPQGEAKPLGCDVPAGYILIVANERGFNDSLSHLQANPREPWPVIRAKLGQTLNLVVCNDDEVATHGFAIEYYMPAGVAIPAHEAFKLNLVLDKAGNFTLYCTILCPSHPYMLNGRLIVEP